MTFSPRWLLSFGPSSCPMPCAADLLLHANSSSSSSSNSSGCCSTGFKDGARIRSSSRPSSLMPMLRASLLSPLSSLPLAARTCW